MLWLLVGLSITLGKSAQMIGSPYTTLESCQEAAALMNSDWLRLRGAGDLEPGAMWTGCNTAPRL
jgi:hypothetical protein